MGNDAILLETSRLLFRKFTEDDAPSMFKLNSDPEVIRFTGDDPLPSVREAEEFIRGYERHRKKGYGRWTLLSKETGEYLGWCGLNYDQKTSQTDLGFRLLRQHWGKGFASEAALACVQYGFNTLELKEIIGRAMEQNIASIRVLQKCGMQFEKEFEEHGGICMQYRITSSMIQL